MKNLKLTGICIVLSFMGMTIFNAVSGHNIKNNKNLNFSVLADGSSGSGSVGTKWEVDVEHFKSQDEKYVYYNDLGERCDETIQYFEVTCLFITGEEDCVPGNKEAVTVKKIICEKPAK